MSKIDNTLRDDKTPRFEVPIEDIGAEQQAAQHNETDDTAQPEPRESVTGTSEESDAIRAFVDRLKRMQAEFDNYKKRTARDAATLQERAADRVLVDILPLYDSLERACLAHSCDDEPAALYEGMLQIRSQFEQLLRTYDVERIETAGAAFDPAVHEAVLAMASDEERNTVLEEVTPGYARGGRTLRPSQVTVSQGPVKHQEEEE